MKIVKSTTLINFLFLSTRTGLSEAELKDILSLDDEVLADIYQYWAPPRSDVIRIPALSWTHLRHDLDEYLVKRHADGIAVLGLYHRYESLLKVNLWFFLQAPLPTYASLPFTLLLFCLATGIQLNQSIESM